MCILECLVFLRDIGLLAAEDEELARLDYGFIPEWSGLANTCVEFSLNLLEKEAETLEVLAFAAGRDFLGGALLRARPHMPELGDVRRAGLDAEFGQQCIVVHAVRRRRRGFGITGQELLTLERGQESVAFFLFADTIQAHGIMPR